MRSSPYLRSREVGGRWLLLPILACVCWMYWPVLSAGHVWDDFTLFVTNAWLRSGHITWEALSQPILPGSNYFRPMVLLSFVVEFRFSGATAAASHAVNLGLLLVNVTLVYTFALGLLGRKSVGSPCLRAALAAFSYGVHPALTESAAWISGRFDLMLTTFVLLALNVEVHVRVRWLRNVLLALFFLAALGCKESAIVLPPALLLVRLSYDWPEKEALSRAVARLLSTEWALVVSLGLAFALYVMAKVGALGNLVQVGEPEGVTTTWGHVVLVLNTLAFYTKMIVAPFGIISPLNPLEVHNVPSVSNGIIVVLALLGIAAAGYAARRRALAGFMLLAGVIALLPVLNLIPLSITDNIGHSRFLTLPLVFFCVAIAAITVRPSPLLRGPVQALVLILTLGGWSATALATTHSIVPLWKGPFTLWHWAYTTNPGFRLAAAQFAVSALRTGQLGLAGSTLERIRQQHGSFTFHEQVFYSEYLLRTGDVEESKRYLHGITDALPHYHARPDEAAARMEMDGTSAAEILQAAYVFLALADAIENRPEQALQNFRAALWYRPKDPRMLVANAIFLEHFGEPNQAKELRERARALVGNEAIPEIERTVIADLKGYPALAVWVVDVKPGATK